MSTQQNFSVYEVLDSQHSSPRPDCQGPVRCRDTGGRMVLPRAHNGRCGAGACRGFHDFRSWARLVPGPRLRIKNTDVGRTKHPGLDGGVWESRGWARGANKRCARSQTVRGILAVTGFAGCFQLFSVGINEETCGFSLTGGRLAARMLSQAAVPSREPFASGGTAGGSSGRGVGLRPPEAALRAEGAEGAEGTGAGVGLVG